MKLNITKDDIQDLGNRLLDVKDEIPKSGIKIRKCETILDTKLFVNNHFKLLNSNINDKGTLNPLYSEHYNRLKILLNMYEV